MKGLSKVTVCNLCGKHLDFFDEHQFYIYTEVGYGSVHDGEELKLDLCCECMDKLIESCKVSPISK